MEGLFALINIQIFFIFSQSFKIGKYCRMSKDWVEPRRTNIQYIMEYKSNIYFPLVAQFAGLSEGLVCFFISVHKNNAFFNFSTDFLTIFV